MRLLYFPQEGVLLNPGTNVQIPALTWLHQLGTAPIMHQTSGKNSHVSDNIRRLTYSLLKLLVSFRMHLQDRILSNLEWNVPVPLF